MLDLMDEWWKELKGGDHVKVDEVTMKEFSKFALSKKIIIDEKELENLFKDLNGNELIAYQQYIR
jgi:hypothetical protein